MINKKIKWLIYTVSVGLIPIISRLIAWLVTKKSTVTLLCASDFIAFGLILHISNINEIEHISSIEQSWKTIQNGISISFIAFYSVLFTLNLIDTNLIDTRAINYCVIALSFVSFIISYSVYDRVSKI